MDLQESEGGAADVSNYIASSQVEMKKFESRRDVMYYECCPEPYVSITIRLQLQLRQAARRNKYE